MAMSAASSVNGIMVDVEAAVGVWEGIGKMSGGAVQLLWSGGEQAKMKARCGYKSAAMDVVPAVTGRRRSHRSRQGGNRIAGDSECGAIPDIKSLGMRLGFHKRKARKEFING